MSPLVQSHWIRPNEISRRPKCWVYLDTEAHAEPVELGARQTWRLAVACHDHRKDGQDRWREPEWGEFTTPGDLWDWIDARSRPGERMVLLAHNLAYDLRIADAFRELPARGWTLDRIRLDYEQGQVRWRQGKRTIQMVDSLAWMPAPLDVIAADVGMAKLDLPEWGDDDESWFARCRSDVEILRTAWRRVLDWLLTEDLGSWQPSGAAQAWSAWRHRFMEHKVLVADDEDARAIERRAVWAGRAEAWRRGKLDDGPFHEFDMQAAYLRVMSDVDVPCRPVGRASEPSSADLERWMGVARVLAVCEVTTDVPIVPAERDGAICWPVGTFSTALWDNELRLAWSVGAHVAVRHVLVYRPAPALAAFAEWCWPYVIEQHADDDPLIRRVVKHWSRALVGRFGVRYRAWEPFGEALGDDVSLHHALDDSTGERFRLLMVGGRALRESGPTEGENAAPMVLGYVAAETRCRLWHAMTTAGLDNLVHVDTDGLIVNGAGARRLARARIEGLRHKGSYASVEVFATRQLLLGDQVRASGVPRRARRVDGATFEAEVWPALGTSIGEGDPSSVRIRRRRITLRGTDRRRVPLDDGTTAPFVLGLDSGVSVDAGSPDVAEAV